MGKKKTDDAPEAGTFTIVLKSDDQDRKTGFTSLATAEQYAKEIGLRGYKIIEETEAAKDSEKAE